MMQWPFSTRAIAVPLGALAAVIALCLAATAGDRIDVTPGMGTRAGSPVPSTGVGKLPDADGRTAAPVRDPSPQEPYYGMHFVPSSDLGTVRDLGAEVVLMALPHDGTPKDWLSYLDAAWAEQISVIAWLWPEGWRWDGAAWRIDEQAELFVRTVSEHPGLLAVYALHEPYWNGCWGCGYTTAEQQALYSAVKAIADVPIHSAVDSMSAWTAHGEETAFADGICDYCETWYHPFRENGTYKRNKVISHLDADLAIARERAPDAKVVWSMQCFAQQGHSRMPTAEEMEDLASIVYDRDVAGALWYPWHFGDLYSDVLSNHPELYDTVRQIYEGHVLPSRSRTGGPRSSD